MFNIFKRKAMIVTIVTIILLITIGVTFEGRAQITTVEKVIGNTLTPVQKFFHLGSKFIADTINPVMNLWKLDEENEKLRKENIKLQNDIIQLELKLQESYDLKSLKRALNYSKENGIENHITCNIIAKDPGNWFNIFIIDGGLEDGITKNSAVMNGDGLIGSVFEVGDTWAKVITIIDNRSRVSFEILSEKNNNIGVINGSGESILNGYLFDPEAEIEIGDQIITSSLGLYPKGILIGKIEDVISKEDDILDGIRVKPSVNFKKLDRVFVIPNNNTLD